MQLFQKQTSESSAVQHSSIFRNSQETFVEELPTKNSIQVSAPPVSKKNASQEANSYLGKYSYKKQANSNSLETTAVRNQADNTSLPTLFLYREVQ